MCVSPLTHQVREDQAQIRNKREEEKDEKNTKDTSTHISEIKCSKCQSRNPKSNERPNKRFIMLKAKGLCTNSKEVIFNLPLRKAKDKTK